MKNIKPIAVVLASGGMDSCVATAIAAQSYSLAMLHINYGQRTQMRELKAFNDIANYYNAENRFIISIEHLAKIGGSSLTDLKMDISPVEFKSDNIPTSYVPFRNANLLSIAVSWAEVIKAEAIFVGAVEEDSSGYPDCRKIFFEAYQSVISTGTKNENPLIIKTPLIDLSKKEIVQKGIELHAPLHLSWSCYKNEEKACGVCESCALRLRGFALAGFQDLIDYEIRLDYQ